MVPSRRLTYAAGRRLLLDAFATQRSRSATNDVVTPILVPGDLTDLVRFRLERVVVLEPTDGLLDLRADVAHAVPALPLLLLLDDLHDLGQLEALDAFGQFGEELVPRLGITVEHVEDRLIHRHAAAVAFLDGGLVGRLLILGDGDGLVLRRSGLRATLPGGCGFRRWDFFGFGNFTRFEHAARDGVEPAKQLVLLGPVIFIEPANLAQDFLKLSCDGLRTGGSCHCDSP